ncbi:MAG: hypothetical protein ACPGRG_04820 [Marinomonas sp.]|jgi:hypothetical protein|uniref:hypothetical protein n=1 Tax=Marinomonas TaxID=28253 RepID=UPI002243079B|nr:hypothetical protein [Marinomonas pontica]MCW8355876.1 hypothetical protein [Marinomonas pontica]
MSFRLPRTPLFTLVTSIGLLASNAVLAHYPYCQCHVDGQEIVCLGGFSDGSDAVGVTVDVISYNEEILVPGQFNNQSTMHFPLQKGEFYVLLDAGPGHTFEVDWRDIEGLDQAGQTP